MGTAQNERIGVGIWGQKTRWSEKQQQQMCIILTLKRWKQRIAKDHLAVSSRNRIPTQNGRIPEPKGFSGPPHTPGLMSGLRNLRK